MHLRGFFMLCFHFYLLPGNFYLFLYSSSFSSVFFNLYEFAIDFKFYCLWSDRIHEVISISSYLLRFVLCLNMWSILEKLSWVTENVFFWCLIFYTYLLGPFDIWCLLTLVLLCLFFVFINHQFEKGRLLFTCYCWIGVSLWFEGQQ